MREVAWCCQQGMRHWDMVVPPFAGDFCMYSQIVVEESGCVYMWACVHANRWHFCSDGCVNADGNHVTLRGSKRVYKVSYWAQVMCCWVILVTTRSFLVIKYVRGWWSVASVNFCPCRYVWNVLIAHTAANISSCGKPYFFSCTLSDLLMQAIIYIFISVVINLS